MLKSFLNFKQENPTSYRIVSPNERFYSICIALYNDEEVTVMKKILLLFVLMLTIAAMLVAGCGDKSSQKQSTTQSQDESQVEVEYLPISQEMLYIELRKNNNSTKQKYAGKPVAVTGKIHYISDKSIVLGDSSQIECLINDKDKNLKDKLFNLNKNQIITVYGVLTFNKRPTIKVSKIDESGNETDTFDKLFDEHKAEYVSIPINVLGNELMQNRAAFEAKYNEKPIVITGLVSGIGKESFKVIESNGENYGGTFWCSVNEASKKQIEQLLNLYKGQLVTVYGIYTLSLGHNIDVDHIIIQ